jgi:hypothetical protein
VDIIAAKEMRQEHGQFEKSGWPFRCTPPNEKMVA